MANLRSSLGVEVRPGKEHAGAQGLPGMWQMLEGLPRERWPAFARGDCGYGNEKIMLEFEERRAQKPMGLERLHHQKARPEPHHGQPHRVVLQLVEPVCALF